MTDSDISTPGRGSRDLFTLFSFSFGFYLGIHMLLIEELSPSWFIAIPPVAGLWLMLKPDSVWRFMLAATLCMADTWIAMPVRSNSTMLTFLMVLFVVISFAGLALKNRSWSIDGKELFDRFAPGGRMALLTMYFFGIFQKLNTGFLDPETSCATLMMTHFTYLPLSFTTHPIIQYAAIYGTFMVEGLIFILLLKPSWRYAGVVLGIAFHLLLSLNDFQYFQPFTMMAFLLHFLFLDPGILDRWRASKIGNFFRRNLFSAKCAVYVWAVCWAVFVLSWLNGYAVSPFWCWLPIGLFILWFVISFGRETDPQHTPRYFLSANIAVTGLAALFFVQCFSPYVGFKTQQTVNMFSSLRTEGGISNHLVFQKTVPLFSYQDDFVTIINSNDAELRRLRDLGNKIIAVDFFNTLARNPHIQVSYIYKGREHLHSVLTKDQENAWKLPLLAHKFLVFQTVPISGPMPCLAD